MGNASVMRTQLTDAGAAVESPAAAHVIAAYGAIHRGIAAAGAGYVEVARLTPEKL